MRSAQEYGKVIIDIDLAQRDCAHPTATRLGTVVADLLPYEDEIRSVEEPDAARGGPEGTAPLLAPSLRYVEPRSEAPETTTWP